MCLVLGLSVPRQNLVVPRPQEILGTIWLEAKLFSQENFGWPKHFKSTSATQMLTQFWPTQNVSLLVTYQEEFNSAQLKTKEHMVYKTNT